MELGPTIAAYRKKRKLTQAGLELRTGIPLATIRSYEQGKRSQLSFNYAIRFAKGLGITLDDLAKCENLSGREHEHDGRRGSKRMKRLKQKRSAVTRSMFDDPEPPAKLKLAD